jgi:mannose-6-phosphate isomerase-like protein (cupin superfamily)
MEDMGDYQVLAHIETPEFSMRLLRLGENAYVAPHYHDESKQLYAVLEGVVEITHGDRTLRLCPYETTHIERRTVHNVRPVGGRALVLSICAPPLKLDDQHPVEASDACTSAHSVSALAGHLQPVGQR